MEIEKIILISFVFLVGIVVGYFGAVWSEQNQPVKPRKKSIPNDVSNSF